MIEIGTTLNQRFLLERELGRGGMGAVYSATDQVLQRSVAIKVLKEQSGEEVGKRLRLEAQIAARLLHENVVRVYDFGQTDQTWFLVMEEVDGTSYSRRWRRLTLVERLRALAQMADALDYAHHQGVVHRDIKPGNVLLTVGDVPKLSDFGLSILIEHGDDSGAIRGTPLYMSPEQTQGTRLDYRSDLYSLGVMIYESSAGSLPFAGGNSSAVMAQHATAPPPPPRARNPEISEELESLILALLSKRAEARPRSAGAVAEALRAEADRAATHLSEGALTVSMPAQAASFAPTAPADGPAPKTAGAARGTTTDAVLPLDAARAEAGGATTETARAEEIPPSISTAANGPSNAPAARSAPADAPAVSVAPTPAPRPAVEAGPEVALVASPLVRKLLEAVLAEPVELSAEERYLHGHYLAYLLSGSRRRGLLLRRPLEPRNADRARLILGLTHAVLAGPTRESIAEAAQLLDERIDVRPALSPVVVAKYLSLRETSPKRKLFRQTRKAIGQASAHARAHMIDARGVLNPGLMPQRLEDLQLIAPPRDEVDDVLVERWNRVTEVWRNEPAFRQAVLRYATRDAHRAPASSALWPEVVYPLIERARWHRRIRSRTEAVWDYLCAKVIHVADAGVVLDRALDRNVPAPLVADLDEAVDLLIEGPPIDDDDEADPFEAGDETERLAASLSVSQASLAEITAAPGAGEGDRRPVLLTDPAPLRLLQGELHELWKDALESLKAGPLSARGGAGPASAPASAAARSVPIGPYRLLVVPSIRGRAAGQVAIQVLPHKRIEIATPSLRTRGSAGKPILAAWVYQDASLVLVHLDFKNAERYVLWDAPRGHQLNFGAPEDLNHELFSRGMEVPDQLDRALSRWFKPRAPA